MVLLYTIILIIFCLSLYVYLFYNNAYKYFERLGVPYIKPFLIFGNVVDIILNRKTSVDAYYEIHKQLDGHRFGGMFFFHQPVFFIRDHDLFNTMLIKDFTYFEDQPFVINEEMEPYVSKSLFYCKGDTWRKYRREAVRVFTNQHMKLVLPLMKKCCEKLIPALEQLTTKEYFLPENISNRYIVDLSSTMFLGIDESTLENPNSNYLKFIINNCSLKFKTLFFIQFPNFPKSFLKLFNMTYYDRNYESLLVNKIQQNLLIRKQNNIKRNDFLDFFMDLKRINGEKVHDNDLASLECLAAMNSKSFLTASYLSSSNILSACLAELAINQIAQNKLRKEIEALCDIEQLNLEVLRKMIYLDMIVSETLRRRGTLITRQCTKNYKIPDSDVVISKGLSIMASSYAIHMDEKYYEKSKEFYPEHFTEEAKSKRPSWAYSPFGAGPRMCIGARLALLQIKLGLIYIFKNYQLEVSSKAEKPIDISKSYYPGIGGHSYSLKIICRKI